MSAAEAAAAGERPDGFQQVGLALCVLAQDQIIRGIRLQCDLTEIFEAVRLQTGDPHA
ncbi:MAG: hypothetical protein ACLUSL_06315 [Ruminococcus sp.]